VLDEGGGHYQSILCDFESATDVDDQQYALSMGLGLRCLFDASAKMTMLPADDVTITKMERYSALPWCVGHRASLGFSSSLETSGRARLHCAASHSNTQPRDESRDRDHCEAD
jgi:hypothetical protein